MSGRNRLAAEGSLYLRQHADNPVDWHPWDDEALALARSENMPILLSIGYSSCHWCHVMAHESFEDPSIAAVMNERFVCVKVDREERPDVDALYMQATLAMTGHGGWPMTVFLTPDGRPFYAGTYFPPVARSGMPGFADLCVQLSEAYRLRPADVERTAAALAARLGEAAARAPSSAAIEARAIDDAVVGLARRFDPTHGGFGGAPKFPPHVALEFLLRRLWRRPDDANALEMIELTLARMADGGIHDQVGGGFHRYAVDGIWLVPHFEKMLYDNALLASAYTLAWRLTGRARWRQVAERTLDYLLREMRVDGGGFASAQDADSPGGEGAFFTWTPEQLAAILTPEEAQLAAAHWGVSEDGNFEHGWSVLHVARGLAQITDDDGAVALLESARVKMMAARGLRPAPTRDDKVVVAWNGLAIAALADAGLALRRPDYLAAAREAAGTILRDGVRDGRLHRTISDGQPRHLGCLDDHAALAHGLLALYAATFEPRWLEAAREQAAAMRALFADTSGSGFFMTGSDAPALLVRPRELEDHPTPAGNSLAAWVLLRLGALLGEPELGELAEAALLLVGEEAVRYPQAFGTALVAMDAAAHGLRQIAIVGPLEEPATLALIEVARSSGGPDAIVAAAAPGDAAAIAACPLLGDRNLVAGAPAAYVCEGFTCQAPVTTPSLLGAALSSH